MPDISLTDFVDFVIKSGTPKLTKVREIKSRRDYDPTFDFWKQLRDGLQRFHKQDTHSKADVKKSVGEIDDPRKIGRYEKALRGYRKFIGRKRMGWFEPPADVWSYGDLRVRVNPELGLEIGGIPHIVKLYFQDEAPTKHRVAAVLDMMDVVFGAKSGTGVKMAVLDVSNGRLIPLTAKDPQVGVLLQGEAAAFLQIWSAI